MTTGPWMETHAGKRLSLPVTEDMIDIEDIAHSLSMQCRYAGHTLRFYSVAEHCIIIADYIAERTGDYQHALAGLLHDASEAYLVDVPKPVKVCLTGYREIEQQVEETIAKKWDLDYPWSDLIKEADCRILHDERATLFNWSGFEWDLPYPDPLFVTVEALDPKVAKDQFLRSFHRYAG